MNYNQAIKWLFKIPLSFNRDYDNYNLKLEPVYKFCNCLGNPQNDLKIIHIKNFGNFPSDFLKKQVKGVVFDRDGYSYEIIEVSNNFVKNVKVSKK